MSEPTLGEVMRILTATTVAQERLTTRLEKVVDDVKAEYATKELVNRDLNEIRGDVAELKAARTKDQDWRRQFSTTLAVTVTGWLLTIALAVFAYISR